MAPEVLWGGLPDLRADVFALGLVCYEMLAGNILFVAIPSCLWVRALSGDSGPAGKLNQRVPSPLADVIAKAMQREPKQRYASARPMASIWA